MGKRIYLGGCDTETTMSGKVADFAMVVTDKKGNIKTQCAVLVREVYQNRDNDPLFHNEDSDAIWKLSRLGARYDAYDAMLDNGTRMLASVSAINRWLYQVSASYNPVLYAYNIAFDLGKCRNTGIDLDIFQRRFCLMHACKHHYATSKKYRQYILDNHLFKPPTKLGNMSYLTKADTMARYILGDSLPPEPHLALEDVLGYELPVLVQLLKKRSVKWLLDDIVPVSWQGLQVKDWYKPV